MDDREVKGAVLCPYHARVVQRTGDYAGSCPPGAGSWLNGAGRQVSCDTTSHPDRAERYAEKVRECLARTPRVGRRAQ